MKAALPRAAGFAALCAALLAITWWRTAEPKGGGTHPVFHPLAVETGAPLAPGLTLEGAWNITGSATEFGGYSALLADRGGHFIAVADGGGRMDFDDPSRGPARARLNWLLDGPEVTKARRDSESMTGDPATGRFWVGYEFSNSIVRFDPSGAVVRSRPKAMRHWSQNAGAESLTRLADGRFIVLAEMQFATPGTGGPALLFPHDPVRGGPPLSFRFVPPRGFFASDMATLPDGRVLILARRLSFPIPPRFAVRLLIADPATIRPGRPWDWQPLARIEGAAPLDNYEGLAVVPQEDGTLALWLISDDNGMALQRSLLLKLLWDWKPRTQKGARIAPRAT